MEKEQHALVGKVTSDFKDPNQFPDAQQINHVELEEFRYNEHGIYSDHSEDEESYVLNIK